MSLNTYSRAYVMALALLVVSLFLAVSSAMLPQGEASSPIEENVAPWEVTLAKTQPSAKAQETPSKLHSPKQRLSSEQVLFSELSHFAGQLQPPEQPSASERAQKVKDTSSPEYSSFTERVQTVSDTSASREVTDSSGKIIRIPATITHVAPTIGAFAQITAMLSQGDVIIAAAATENMNARFKKIFPSYAQENSRNYDVNSLEDIIISGAQVVYGPAGRLSDEQITQLEAVGIPFILVNAMRTSQDLSQSIVLIGDILGGKSAERGRSFADYYHRAIQDARDRTKVVRHRPRFISLFYAGNTYMTVNKQDIVHDYIESAGAENITAEYNVFSHSSRLTVDSELLVRWDPEIIMVSSVQGKKALLADSALQTVSAIQNKKVYVCPHGLYLWSVRSAEGAMLPAWLGTKIHPELFADIDMRQVVKDFFATWYAFSLSDDEITAVLAGIQ